MRGETSSTPAANGVGDSDSGVPSGCDEGDSDSDVAEPLLDHVDDGVAPAHGSEHEVVSGETRSAPVDDGVGVGDSGLLSCCAEGVSDSDAAEPVLDPVGDVDARAVDGEYEGVRGEASSASDNEGVGFGRAVRGSGGG